MGTKKILVLPLAILLLGFLPPFAFAQNNGCQKVENGVCAELKWEKIADGLGEVAEIAIAPSDPTIMYAAFENNAHSLYKSKDGGKTWKKVSGPGDHAKDVAVSPKDSNKAYHAMSESVMTTDLSFKSAQKSRYNQLFGITNPEVQVLLSSGISAGPAEHSFSSIEVSESNDQVIYAALRGGEHGIMGPVFGKLFKTENGGRDWIDIPTDLGQINVVAISPNNPNKLYVGGRDGVYVSVDSGKTLNLSKGIEGVISLEVSPSALDVVVSAGSENAFVSQDGGITWEDITGPLKDIHRVRVSASNPNTLYAATFNGIYKSTDTGKTWQDITSNLKTKNFQIVTIHPTNPEIAYAGTSSLWSSVRSSNRYRTGLLAHQGIYKTEDGGKTWQKSDGGIMEYDFEEVATNPKKPYEAWFAGVASGGGYKTEDGGQNWRLSQLSTLHYPMRIKYSLQNPNKLYATSWHTGGPFAISSDGGVNWEEIDQRVFFDAIGSGKSLYNSLPGEPGSIHIHGLAVDPTNDKIAYAGSVEDAFNPNNFPLKGAHIFKSTDGGKTWAESDEGFPHDQPTAVHDVKIDPQNSQVVYVSTTEDEAKVGVGIYKSEDAGKSWRAVNSGLGNLSVPTIVISPQNSTMLVAATDGGLYKTTDGGKSWQLKNPAGSFDVEYVEDEPNILYASTDKGVLKSRDFGGSWYEVNLGLPEGEGQGIGVDKTGEVLYAAVNWGGLYVARLKDIPQKDLPSEFGKGYGFGRGIGMMNEFNIMPFLIGGIGFFVLLIMMGTVGVILGRKKNGRMEQGSVEDNNQFDV